MTIALGINGRNAVIARRNPRRAIVDAKDKLVTKQRLSLAGIPVPATIGLVADRRAAKRFDDSALPEQWVVKPSRGSGGRGVTVVVGRDRPTGMWRTPSRPLSTLALRRHLVDLVGGEFSDGDDDVALIEPLLRSHPDIAELTVAGLPDIRIVCDGSQPLLAMARIPTIASGGRGNLHQGGIGAAVDLRTGRIERALHRGTPITRHPDTNHPIVGRTIPSWHSVIEIATRCSAATGLGYLGVDLVVDDSEGPLVLEVNSHPGLEIQNITGRALRPSTRRKHSLQSRTYDAPVPVRRVDGSRARHP